MSAPTKTKRDRVSTDQKFDRLRYRIRRDRRVRLTAALEAADRCLCPSRPGTYIARNGETICKSCYQPTNGRAK